MEKIRKPGRQRRREDIARTRFLSTCGWCGKKLGSNEEVFTVGGKMNEAIDMENLQGKVLPYTLPSQHRTLTAYAPTSASLAKQQGQDIVFMLCSETCCLELKRAMAGERRKASREDSSKSVSRKSGGSKDASKQRAKR